MIYLWWGIQRLRWPNFAHYWPPTFPGWHWLGNVFTVIKKISIPLTFPVPSTYLPRLVNIVKERPLVYWSSFEYIEFKGIFFVSNVSKRSNFVTIHQNVFVFRSFLLFHQPIIKSAFFCVLGNNWLYEYVRLNKNENHFILESYEWHD